MLKYVSPFLPSNSAPDVKILIGFVEGRVRYHTYFNEAISIEKRYFTSDLLIRS
jgi:hypothetical protein